MKRLFTYAGSFRYLTIASWILSVISAWFAMVPFYFIWRIIKQVLETAPDFENSGSIVSYGWMAVAAAVGSMLIYIIALMCSHIAAFRVPGEYAPGNVAPHPDAADGRDGPGRKRTDPEDRK